MKTLVLGDIHGRICWWDIIQKENPDRVIFMGDYVSTHDKNISQEQQCSNLEDILNFKRERNGDVILLRGNHDMQHLGYPWAECSGFFPKVHQWMSGIKEDFLELTQWVYVEDNTIFSHAGISKEFWEYLNLGEPTVDNILKINEIEPSSLFAFTPAHFSDHYGDSTCQPLTWIRPGALLDSHLDGWEYVVGHTRVSQKEVRGNIIKNLTPDQIANWNITMKALWCVDELPFYYMIIEDGEKRMVKYGGEL